MFVFSLFDCETETPSVVESAAIAKAVDSASAGDATAVITQSPGGATIPPSRRTLSETEFVSDTLQTTDTDLAEVKAGMKLLGIDTLARATDSGTAGKTRRLWGNRGARA